MTRDMRSIIGRKLLGVLVLALGILGVTLPAHAQEGRSGAPLRIGRLSPLSAATDASNLEAFRKGLAERAADRVRQKVDVILVGSTPGTAAARKATATIPIVMVTTGDPVAGGLVASLARPGGNVTGVTALGQMLNAKRLELIKETLPGVTRVAVLLNPASPYTDPFLRERESAGRALGLQLGVHEARSLGEL